MRNVGKLRVRSTSSWGGITDNTFHLNTPVEAVARFADTLKKLDHDVDITKVVLAERRYIVSVEGGFLIDTGVNELPLHVEKA